MGLKALQVGCFVEKWIGVLVTWVDPVSAIFYFKEEVYSSTASLRGIGECVSGEVKRTSGDPMAQKRVNVAAGGAWYQRETLVGGRDAEFGKVFEGWSDKAVAIAGGLALGPCSVASMEFPVAGCHLAGSGLLAVVVSEAVSGDLVATGADGVLRDHLAGAE